MPPASLDAEQQSLYERIAQGPRASGPFKLVDNDGTLTGPFGLLLLAPGVGSVLSDLGEAIRYHTSFTGRVREIAILAVAAERKASYEWYAHELVGRNAGLVDADLDAIRRADADHWKDPAEAAAHRAALALVRERALPGPVFTEVQDTFGAAGIVELTALVGYYDTLDLLMSAFEVGVPPGNRDPFA